MRYNPPLEKSLTIKAVWRHFQLVFAEEKQFTRIALDIRLILIIVDTSAFETTWM